MKTNIQFKSVLLGLAAGVAAVLLVGAAPDANPVGRYQIGGTDNHALIIDTKTGRVWHGYFPSNGGTTDPDFLNVKLPDRYDQVK